MLPRNELEVNLAAARAWRMNENRKLSDLAAAGAAQIGKAEPVAEAGLFAAALEPWQAGTSYAKRRGIRSQRCGVFCAAGGSIRRASAAGQHGHGGHLRRSSYP